MRERKKICICFPFMGDSIGGSHLSALELIKRLDNFYFYPLIVLHKKGILYNYLERRKISFFFLPLKYFVGNKKGIFLNIKNLFLNFFKLNSFLNKNSIQFVHSNDSSIHLNWIIASKFSKCKFFWHLRIKFPDWRLYKILINFSDKIICISRYVYNTVPNKLKFKSVIIYNPISLLDKIENKNEKILISKFSKFRNKKKILFMANIIESKKLDIFVKSALEIFKKKNFIFIIIGSDKYKIFNKIFFNLKNKKFKKNIFFLNYSYNIKYWLKNADILLVPAINEGHNRTIVESMLAKLPVIASNSGGHKETIINKKNGWLFRTNNYTELAKLTLNFFKLSKSKKEKIKIQAYKTAFNKFNPEKNKKKIENLYRSI